MAKRGGWQSGWDRIKEEGAVIPPRPPEIQPNYLRHTSREEKAFKVKEEYVNKIHQANKIKEQFMKIHSECPKCNCYDNFEKFNHTHRSATSFARTAYKTSEGWGRASRAASTQDDKPLESVYNQMKFLS